MAKPNKIALTENGVISQEALLAYVEGKLDAASVQELEKMLQEDVFAQEALEGLRNANTLSSVGTSVIAINNKLRDKTGLKDKKKAVGIDFHWANYAYAAVVFGVLIGCGFLIVNYLGNSNNTIAENKNQQNVEIQEAPAQTAETASVQDTTISSKENSQPLLDSVKMYETTVADEQKLEGVKNEKAKEEVSPAPAGSVTATVTTAKREEAVAEAPKPAAAMTYRADDALESADGKASSREKKADAKSLSKEAESAKESDQKKSVNLEEAMTLFNSGEFKKAASKFDEELKVHPENAEALYFGGVSNYISGENNNAQQKFEKLIKKGVYTDGAKWYKANVLLRKGNKEEAKQIIRELTNTTGSYKERAIKKYDELSK
jgi:tetratricopeptide (TPR) repeat protein